MQATRSSSPRSALRQRALVFGVGAVSLAVLAASCSDTSVRADRDERATLASTRASSALSRQAEARGVMGAAPTADVSAKADGFAKTANEVNQAAPPPVAPAPGMPPVSAVSQPSVSSSMIIRTGYAGVEVDSLDAAIARVRQLAQRVGGFVANTEVQGGKDQLRTASLEVKVPSDRFDEALAGLAPIGKVESVNVNAQDVGEEYVDIAARVETAHRLEARLIALLANRTGQLLAVISVERELARVREEIERYEGRMRYLRSRVALSTLTIAVHERAPIIVPVAGDGPIVVAFREAWRNFVGFIAGLIASLGVLVPLGTLVFVAFLGARRWIPWRPTGGTPPAA
jgi:hypothetical protein